MNKRNFIVKGIKAIPALFSPVVVKAQNTENGMNIRRVKMLTADGRLVWVDMKESQIAESKPRITNQALYSWIKTNRHESG